MKTKKMTKWELLKSCYKAAREDINIDFIDLTRQMDPSGQFVVYQYVIGYRGTVTSDFTVVPKAEHNPTKEGEVWDSLRESIERNLSRNLEGGEE